VNPKDEWVISRQPVHTVLVSEQDFVAAQAINAVATPADGMVRTYLLVGLLRGVWASAGIALGAWPARLPMSPRAIQRPAALAGPAQAPLPS
jgi:hypothetical protein